MRRPEDLSYVGSVEIYTCASFTLAQKEKEQNMYLQVHFYRELAPAPQSTHPEIGCFFHLEFPTSIFLTDFDGFWSHPNQSICCP